VATEVRLGERRWPVEPGAPFRFGRLDGEGVIGLDAYDVGISRIAGEVRVDEAGVWTANLSTTRPLWLDVGAGHLSLLRPGQRQVLSGLGALVVVRGEIREHHLEVVTGASEIDQPPVAAEVPGPRTLVPADLVSLTDAERDAVVAVVADYLMPPPRRRALPRGYEEAAELLAETSASTVRKRIERVIAKFAAQGLYFTGADARHELADFVVEHGMVGPEDLARIQAP
jgi:hypothetical protein